MLRGVIFDENRRNRELGINNREIVLIMDEDRNITTTNRRRQDIVVADEVAGVFVPGPDGQRPTDLHIVAYPIDGPLFRILPNISHHTDPLCYTLLFPHGEAGWKPDLHYTRTTGRRSRISMLEFYSFRLAIREQFNPLLHAGKLITQQFIVDCWVKVESDRLNYYSSHQPQMRTELYSGLMDHVNRRSDAEGLPVGRICVLPSSFVGSPRCMVSNYQDALSIVRALGKPDLFVTFTCNNHWPEIDANLTTFDSKREDRPDVVVRVFQAKFAEFLDDLMVKRELLGKVVAYVYTIELQERGLPHAHCLFILDEPHKIKDPWVIDQIVSAELPDGTTQPPLQINIYMGFS